LQPAWRFSNSGKFAHIFVDEYCENAGGAVLIGGETT
jgi:hypothetical protein